jgi:hypothetical protein
VGEPFLDAYCASKFALEGMMQPLAPVSAASASWSASSGKFSEKGDARAS